MQIQSREHDSDLRSKPPAQDEDVTAEDEDAAHTELNRRIVGRQQGARHSGHAEHRQSKRAQSQVFAAACGLGHLCGPDVPGQETSETLKTKPEFIQAQNFLQGSF